MREAVGIIAQIAPAITVNGKALAERILDAVAEAG